MPPRCAQPLAVAGTSGAPAGVGLLPPGCAQLLAVAGISVPPASRSSARWTRRRGWCWPRPRRRLLAPRKNSAKPFTTGVLNVDKAAGETSFAVVSRLRRLTGAHRVGHAGTLDPLATGVLPILFESATRLAEFALRLPKTYVADIHLGFTTATDDAEADREAVGDPSILTATEVATALEAFSGRILQEPPAFSAVKVDGKRAYKLARRGEEPRPRAREVEGYEAGGLDSAPGAEAVARVEIRCSSGTYLRSIARDL